MPEQLVRHPVPAQVAVRPLGELIAERVRALHEHVQVLRVLGQPVGDQGHLDVARGLLTLLGKEESCLSFVADRPGHDMRYALNNKKIKNKLGWKSMVAFQEGMEQTVAWYQENKWWWGPLKERLTKESKGFWSVS